ncbi:MAG: hypothetical protein ABFC18_03175 [Rikenellaceae bacterium]
MDRVEGYGLLKKIIDKNIVHEDYDHVTKLADKYYKMKTGDGIDELLHKIETRVTDEEFEQIKRIYKSIIPSTLNSTKMPFLKATRKLPKKTIDFETDSEKKEAELQEYINKYWGDKSLEKFMEYAYVDYNYIDPNAFLITEFDEFDPRVEKASPYPFVASSTQAIMFEYKNEILQYLVIKTPNKYFVDNIENNGDRYTMYLGWDTIVFDQIGSINRPENADDTIEIRSKYYAVYYYEPKNDKVPAIRFGYLRDEETRGRTYVSVFHCVIQLLEKTLKVDSELDLSCAMVAFPQRFAYTTPCRNPGCNKGYMADGKTCDKCNGTGTEPFHKGTQDVVTLALPRDVDQMIDLNNLLVYKGPDIGLLQFDSDFLDRLEKKVHQKMFNADLYTRDQVSTTATEQLLEADNLNDTLYGFAQNYSSIWIFVVRDIATFTDLGKGLILTHQFPKDFKFKTLTELMTELKMAKDANASSSTIAAIEDDINELLYADRPDDLRRINVKNMLNPYRGYSETDIRFIISQGNTTQYQRTLWENFESIFQDLESVYDSPWLYDMANSKIRELVKAKTEEYMKLIQGEKQAKAEFEQEYATNNNFNNE